MTAPASPAARLRAAAAVAPDAVAERALGAALAVWLETTAARLEQTTHPGWQATVEPHALAVADALLAPPP